jgi:hypothetical protein
MGFTLQGFGPFLHWLTLGILCLLPILLVYVLYRLGSLPGEIARSRNHPQAEAINICGWMGIITIVLWPIAMVWAYLRSDRPLGGGAALAPNNVVIDKLKQASQRLEALERKLGPQRAAGGA